MFSRNKEELSIASVASKLGVRKKTIKKMMKHGDLPYKRNRWGRRVVTSSDFKSYRDSGSKAHLSYKNASGQGSTESGGFFDDLGDIVDGIGDLFN